MSDTSTHVSAEPVEASEPSPTTREDLIRYRAVLHGWRVLKGVYPNLTFEMFAAGVNAYEFHRDCASLDVQEREERAHARRRDDPARLSEWATILRLAEQRKEGR